jgi:hypothetical protein
MAFFPVSPLDLKKTAIQRIVEKFDQNDFEFKDMNHIDRAMVVDRDGKVNLLSRACFFADRIR